MQPGEVKKERLMVPKDKVVGLLTTPVLLHPSKLMTSENLSKTSRNKLILTSELLGSCLIYLATKLIWRHLDQATFSLLPMGKVPKEGSSHLNDILISVLTKDKHNPDKKLKTDT